MQNRFSSRLLGINSTLVTQISLFGIFNRFKKPTSIAIPNIEKLSIPDVTRALSLPINHIGRIFQSIHSIRIHLKMETPEEIRKKLFSTGLLYRDLDIDGILDDKNIYFSFRGLTFCDPSSNKPPKDITNRTRLFRIVNDPEFTEYILSLHPVCHTQIVIRKDYKVEKDKIDNIILDLRLNGICCKFWKDNFSKDENEIFDIGESNTLTFLEFVNNKLLLNEVLLENTSLSQDVINIIRKF